MPLIKSGSKQAMSKNISAEMNAGKPQKQSIAIAYSIKRQAGKKKKKFADGGSSDSNQTPAPEPTPTPTPDNSSTGQALASIRQALSKAKGGMIKRPKKFAAGGELDANDESTEENSADARTQREMEMLDSESTEHSPELDARNESMEGDSIDGSEDERELEMARVKHKMAHGGEFEHEDELDARDESLSGNSIDDAASSRDEEMLDSKSTSHSPELHANDETLEEDSADHRSDRSLGMLDQHEQPDSYSKDGIIRYAKGGIAAAIIDKRKRMADGGDVDLQDNNGNEWLNREDQMSFDAARKKTYFDDSQISSQPKDSNLHGDVLKDEDQHDRDMISMIRRRMKSRRF